MSVPPGASYRVSNALTIAARHLLNLEDPVRIQFGQEWQKGNPLFDWYSRRSCRLIDTIQLRKERESPFFHEYIVFKLKDNGGYFRIDRRQRPDENTPLDCIYKNGVDAHDTIEQVTSLDDALCGPSDCLVEIKFKVKFHLVQILRICWAIQKHPHARVYTLQRYNCYFFAQTVLACAARSVIRKFYDLNHPSEPAPESSHAIRDSIAISLQGDVSHLLREHTPEFPTVDMPPEFPVRSLKQSPSSDSLLGDNHIMLNTKRGSKLSSQGKTVPVHRCDLCASSVPHLTPEKLAGALERAQSSFREFWDKELSSIFEATMSYKLDRLSFPNGLWLNVGHTDDDLVRAQLAGGINHIYKPRLAKTRWRTHSQNVTDQFVSELSEYRRCARISISMAQWRKPMAQYFNSQYEHLDQVLRRQAVELWLRRINRGLEKRIVIRAFGSAGCLQDLITELIAAHSNRVELYKFALRCTASELKQDIMSAMNDIWRTFDQTSEGWE